MKRSHKTVEKWRVDFLKSGGELPEFLRGTYARMDCISNDENLTRAAKEYVRENAFKKGAANMTARVFSSWVNNELLPNSTLESGSDKEKLVKKLGKSFKSHRRVGVNE